MGRTTKVKRVKIPKHKSRIRPNAKVIETDKQLFDYLDQYIKEEGFIITAKSFGSESWKDETCGETKSVPNEYKYYVLVTITGFNQWLERGHNYINRLVNEFEDGENGVLTARIREKLLAHNYKGLSIEHISPKAFDFWKLQTFGRDEMEFKKEMNKIKLELAKEKLEQEKAATRMLLKAEENADEDTQKIVVNRVLGSAPLE